MIPQDIINQDKINLYHNKLVDLLNELRLTGAERSEINDVLDKLRELIMI